MQRGRAAALVLALALGGACADARAQRPLPYRLEGFEAILEGRAPPPPPDPGDLRRVRQRLAMAVQRVVTGLRPGPALDEPTARELQDLVRRVGDVPLGEWFATYAGQDDASLVEVPIMLTARSEWLVGLMQRLDRAGVRSLEDLPVPDPRITRLLLQAWDRRADREVAEIRLDTIEVLDALGGFEAVLGESFQAGLEERTRRWIQPPLPGEPEVHDRGPPPRVASREITARAEEGAARWPGDLRLPQTLGDVLAARGGELKPLDLREEPSLLRRARYQRELRLLQEEEAPLREALAAARDSLSGRDDIPFEFREAARSLVEEVQASLGPSELVDLHEDFRHPHASPQSREELGLHLDLWRRWREGVVVWVRSREGMAEFPLPGAEVLEALLEKMRGTMDAPFRGPQHVFRRAETLAHLDELGAFEACSGERFFTERLTRNWSVLRDEDRGEVETDARLKALELELGARIGQVMGLPGWRLPRTFAEAFALRGERLGDDLGAGAGGSLLRLAYQLIQAPRPPPGGPPPPPPTEVPPPPTWDGPDEPLDAAPVVPEPDRRRGPPPPLILAVLLLGAGGASWAWRRRGGVPSLEKVPAPPVEGLGTTPPTVVPVPDGPAAVSSPETLVRPAGDDGRTRVSQPGASAPASTSSDTVVSEAGAPPGVVAAPGATPDRGLPSWLRAALEGALGERYRDHVMLGAGGMGTVVRSFDVRLERVVAVKVPPPHLASHEQFQIRFLREARAVARLDHPNIGRVIDVPEVPEGELPVMILEYLDGLDLATQLDRHGRPSGKQALGWIRQAGAGLQHAHEQGILHRDIKPANLMLVGDQVKILDFGLAALEDRKGLTRSGMLMGSIPYMPPEQLRGEVVGVPADVYALGVTAYQLLTGKLPFDPEDAKRLRVPRVSQAGTGAPAVLDDLLLRALAPDPKDRFETVRDFLAAIEDLARHGRSSN